MWMPRAGFYPDPSKRYVSRYWSGTEWTERVRDYGDEYADAVRQSFQAPGVSVMPVAGFRGLQNRLGTLSSQPWRVRRSEFSALEWAIALGLLIVAYGVAAWFGLFGWMVLATIVYYAFAFIILQIALRGLGIIDPGRVNLIAELVAIIPAAAALWLPLHSVGFHPHGSWTNIVCAFVTVGNCK
jgi:Protein of unknown function (DUF2510)